MIGTGMIVSIISVIACLILVTRGAPFRNLGMSKTVQYAAIWAAIIIGLVLLIQVTGFRIEQ
ncbi:hypothetical protein [Novosphingobium album (ex Hu et al. 2023)]|uniref:Uncharacterized protein n=1 Tax=Novosphingobium album (ex Hu et al. 2023) TaxID=2930093 RepID=A0ABT0AXD5_9SPHN|nr:hypothetical protein [Novosphingobium album (ex Hu et al. 2023)]MCJ2177469.1 hypothetical protein [Novosphingobium album (ex Hu et al. 2023)]